MRDSDAFSWYMEADPLLRSTIVSVMVLEREPDAARVLERVERASRLAPGFRKKVVSTPMRWANPRWVTDPDFDLEFHARHIAVPAPGSREQVFEYACQTGMAGFDRQRPLWEFTLVDGLSGGRAALIMKLHHALTDGIGGMEMARYLFDLSTDGDGPESPPPDPHGERLTSVDLARDAIWHNVRRSTDLVRGVVTASCRALQKAARDPGAAIGDGVRVVESIGRTVRPVNETLSPVMRERRLAWRYDAFVVPLETLHGVARSLDLSLNDAFLAALSDGLLRYHLRHGLPVDELRITMPISIRTAGDPIGGNRITLMRFKLPTSAQDPAARMRRIHELCLSARHEPAIPYTNAIAATLNLLPRGVVGSMLKHVDFLASNVPGIDVPIYLAGVPVTEWYAFGPTIGAALNVTLVSYDGACYIGVNTDTGAIPDGDAMIECLREGFDEVAQIGELTS